MRTVSGGELTVLTGQRLNIHTKLEIKNASGTWKDYSALAGKDYFVGVRLSTDVDSPVWSMQATLKRDGEAATESLSPLRGDSTLNVDDSLFPAPAINAAREWRVSVAVVAAGAAIFAGDWKELCAGYLDKPDFTADPMSIEGRSVGVRLMDTTIRVKRTYSGTFEDVAQQIVTDNLPSPVPTLFIPSPPAFTVTDYTPFQVSVMDALVTLALSTGWMVRDVYDPADSTMKTAIIDPNRTQATADATISPTTYLTVDGASLDVGNIRNVIEGEWVDAVTDEVFTLTVTDPASIAAFGNIERYMKFSEDATSPIDTGNEMLDMLNAALADLSTPNFDHVVTSTLFWPSEIADLYDFTGNAVHYDTTQRLAVFGIVHDLTTPGHGTTQWTCRGKPSGAFMEWIRRQGAGPTGPEVPPATVLNWMVAEGTQYGGTTDEVDGAIWVGFTLPAGVDEMRIHALLGDGANLGVPSIIDPTTHAATIRRPDGDVGAQPEYGSIAILSTDTNFYKRIAMYSVRGGLTSRPVVAPTDGAMQAIDPVPMVVEGTVASQSVVQSGETNTVTVTPGTLEPTLGMNYVCITRNKQILLCIPIGTSTAPVVFTDSGLDPSKSSSYSYDSFIGNLGPTWFVTGKRRSTIVEAPTIVAPYFTLGTPMLANVSGQARVQISYHCDTPSATQVRVEATLDTVNIRTVDSGTVPDDTLYDTVTTNKLYRLVARNILGVRLAYSPWVWQSGLPPAITNPAGSPQFNGLPHVVFGSTFPTPTLVLEIKWTCETPGAASVGILRSTAGAGGPFTQINNSSAVSSGTYRSLPSDGFAQAEAWYKLVAHNAIGTDIATSAVVHYIPPS